MSNLETHAIDALRGGNLLAASAAYRTLATQTADPAIRALSNLLARAERGTCIRLLDTRTCQEDPR